MGIKKKAIRKMQMALHQFVPNSFSHGCRRASSPGGGAFGSTGKFSVLPRPPSMREVAANSVSRRKELLPFGFRLHHAPGNVQAVQVLTLDDKLVVGRVEGLQHDAVAPL